MKASLRPSKEFLEQLYLQERLGSWTISKKLGVSKSTVLYWLNHYGITRRASKATLIYVPSKAELEELYWSKGLSQEECAKKLGITRAAIRYYMNKYKMPTRSHFEAMKLAHQKYPEMKKVSLECRKKISETLKKKPVRYWKGKNMPSSAKDKLRDLMLKRWQNPEYRREIVRKIMAGNRVKPNKAEQNLIKIIRENYLPYKYVGDGQIIVDGKCPDFINSNGEKKIIELFSDFWHKHSRWRTVPYHQTEKGTKTFYQNHGYKLLIVWEHELSNEREIARRIINL